MKHLIWVSLIALSGCSMQSSLFSLNPTSSGVVITKPPMRIVYTGELNKEDKIFALALVRELKDVNYSDYNFNENVNVNLSINANKSDIVSQYRSYNKQVE